MPLILYGHPFSSYCQKALIAFYENNTPFEFRMLDAQHEDHLAEFAERWPLKRFPTLVDGDRTLLEASIIIEYLALSYPGSTHLIPENSQLRLEARMMDRVFDNYVMTPLQKIVGNALRPEEHRDPYGVDEARRTLDSIYAWLDARLAGREWAVGDSFSIADCAAAPSLFYADWAHPIEERHANLKAYRARLLARPSMARAVEEARPYRPFFPLGAPDRD